MTGLTMAEQVGRMRERFPAQELDAIINRSHLPFPESRLGSGSGAAS